MVTELIIFWGFLASFAIAIVLLVTKKISKKVFQFITIIVLSISVLEFGMNYASTSTNFEAPQTPSIEFLKKDDSVHRVFGTGVILQPDSQMYYGISSIKGKDILRPFYFMQVFRAIGDMRAPALQHVTDYSSNILDMLNVKWSENIFTFYT